MIVELALATARAQRGKKAVYHRRRETRKEQTTALAMQLRQIQDTDNE